MPFLQKPAGYICNAGEGECQFETDIAAVVWIADKLTNGSDEPRFGNSKDTSHDPKRKSNKRCKAGREGARLVPIRGIVSGEASPEDEMLCERDGLVDASPVCL